MVERGEISFVSSFHSRWGRAEVFLHRAEIPPSLALWLWCDVSFVTLLGPTPSRGRSVYGGVRNEGGWYLSLCTPTAALVGR